MPTHAEVADIVEEDDARRARGIDRLADERPDKQVRAARFEDHGATEIVEPFAEELHAVGERTRAQLRSAGDDHARRLAGGVGVYDADALKVGHGDQTARGTLTCANHR